MDTNTKTRSRQRNGDHVQGSRRRSVSPSPTRQKQRKRGKRRSGRGGHRRKMRKADRLSKRYFRICSWNCASANRRGAVLEKMVYDFDVVCLQETRTCPNRPLVLQGFTVIQRHEGCGMTIVVRSDLSKAVSLLNLDRWSTSSHELQGIQIKKKTLMRDTNPWFSLMITSTLPPVSQGQVVISLRRWKMNWETQLWYAVISVHGQVCKTNMAPTNRDVH